MVTTRSIWQLSPRFRFGGRKFKRSLHTKNAANAEGRRCRLEENIRLVESGRLEVPMGADIPLFLLSDGKIDCKPIAVQNRTISTLFTEYLAGLPQESLEADTLYTVRIHMEHIERILGSRFSVAGLTEAHLQNYVLHRSRESGRHGKRLSPTTIKKELGTFSSVWSWAVRAVYVARPFPNKGLRFPKAREKPPFQTWEEIEGKIRSAAFSICSGSC
ncbi:MAG: hypothetical protein H8E66_04340 [Planctomycetes bacterium]|nr:hypothetical protein [Planctomycetota bacterium]